MNKVYYLPYPPSVNHYYGTKPQGKRVIKYIGKEGKKYRLKLERDVMRQGLQTIYDKVKCKIEFYPPDNRKRDNDNILKAFLDAIVHCRVLADDSQIDQLHVLRGQNYKGVGMVVLTIEEADDLCLLPNHLAQQTL